MQRTDLPVFTEEATKLINGKTILVTGAGGSIGSELSRQLSEINQEGRTFFLDNSEYNLYTLQLSLTARPLLTEPEFILADITNRPQIQKIFDELHPEIVFHAAAYKQLPLLEKSPENAIKTNVLGTEIVADTCARNNVSHLVNISTDKASSPTSILGMTKRLAENIVANHATDSTRTASVRFGNVFNSRGSFIETLRYQIKQGLPITITDQRMSRYFMTVPEAAGLVIQATTLTNHGSIYLLDMGEQVKIIDLVKRYCELIDLRAPDIVFTGTRQGEKLEESLLDPDERYRKTLHPRILEVDAVASPLLREDLDILYYMVEKCCSPIRLRKELARLISEKSSDETVIQRNEVKVLSC